MKVARDGIDLIGQGRHERFVLAWDRCDRPFADKARPAVGATA
jgi:hypothetical protein